MNFTLRGLQDVKTTKNMLLPTIMRTKALLVSIGCQMCNFQGFTSNLIAGQDAAFVLLKTDCVLTLGTEGGIGPEKQDKGV